MRKIPLLLVTSVLLAGSAQAASRPETEQKKIDLLIAAVETSPGRFLRNDSEYDGAKAASHLKMKLSFAGKRVQTAEDFITGVASISSSSGRPYEVKLPDGQRVPLGDWLRARLKEAPAP